jgi:hypothetical protein
VAPNAKDKYSDPSSSHDSYHEESFFNDEENEKIREKKLKIKRGYTRTIAHSKYEDRMAKKFEEAQQKHQIKAKATFFQLSQLPNYLLSLHQDWFQISPSPSYQGSLKMQKALNSKMYKKILSQIEEFTEEEDDSSENSLNFNKFKGAIDRTPCRAGVHLKNISYIATHYEAEYRYDVFDEKLLEKRVFQNFTSVDVAGNRSSIYDSHGNDNWSDDKYHDSEDSEKDALEKKRETIKKYKQYSKLEKQVGGIQKDLYDLGVMGFCIKGT